MSKSLRTTIIAVFLPAAVLSLVIALLEFSRGLFGWPGHVHSTSVVVFAIVAEAAISLFTFLSIRRLLSPMENKLNKFRQAVETLTETVDRSSLGVLSFDRNGTLYYANQASRDLFGFGSSDSTDSNLFRPLNEPSRTELAQAMLTACERGNADLDVELLPDADGAARILSVHMTVRMPRKERPQKYFSALVNDITEKKRLEREYAEAKERERRLNQSRSDFLARISHEIRTPLHAVVNLAGELDRSAVPEHGKENLERIELLSRHLLRTVNEFLDWTQLEADQIALEQEPFQLSRLLDNVMTMLKALTRGKPIRLLLERDPAIPEWLSGDSYRLEQILINLVGNAAKFTEEGFIRLSAGLEGGVDDAARVQFIVRDTGIGMTEEQLGRLFRRYQQADVSIRRHYGGSGLGLVIAKRLVELMGGRLEAESDPGSGTEFRFSAEFGLADGDIASTAQPPEASASSESPAFESASSVFHRTIRVSDGPNGSDPRSPGRVLLVDDDEMNRQITRRMLVHVGADVVTAARAREALRLLDSGEPFGLILMDLHMPEMDGIEAVRHIRKNPRWRSIPIVMLTADTDDDPCVECFEAGVQQIVAKPVDLKQLQETLNRWLGPLPGSKRHPPSLPISPAGHPPLEGLDARQALNRLNGDRALYVHLLDKMSERYGRVVSKLERLLVQGDLQQAVRILHSLRGSSGLLAADNVYEAARRCEEAISHSRGGDTPSAPPAEMAELLRTLDRELQIAIDSAAKYKKSISLP